MQDVARGDHTICKSEDLLPGKGMKIFMEAVFAQCLSCCGVMKTDLNRSGSNHVRLVNSVQLIGRFSIVFTVRAQNKHVDLFSTTRKWTHLVCCLQGLELGWI